jgi:D-aminopeptidase
MEPITDVVGVRVGYTTLTYDTPAVVRTGVTAMWPRGPELWTDAVFAGIHSFNGNGEMTGWAWIAEQGLLASPICLTNTYSVGVVRDAVCALAVREKVPIPWLLPVVAETYDGWLSDASSFPVATEHAIAALDAATTGPIAEGNAAAEATEEAILNARTSAETMTGFAGHTAHAVPLDRLAEAMKRHRP